MASFSPGAKSVLAGLEFVAMIRKDPFDLGETTPKKTNGYATNLPLDHD